MVPPRLLKSLRHSFSAMKSGRIDIHSYTGQVYDAVFDIITVETGIAGIADRLLDSESIEQHVLQSIADDRLVANQWRSLDGRLCSLESVPEVLEYARRVEETRKLCLKIISKQGDANGPLV